MAEHVVGEREISFSHTHTKCYLEDMFFLPCCYCLEQVFIILVLWFELSYWVYNLQFVLQMCPSQNLAHPCKHRCIRTHTDEHTHTFDTWFCYYVKHRFFCLFVFVAKLFFEQWEQSKFINNWTEQFCMPICLTDSFIDHWDTIDLELSPFNWMEKNLMLKANTSSL